MFDQDDSDPETARMPLTALPPELLHLIAEQAMPDGFESFLLSCRTVFESAKSLLARHNHLRRTYSSVAVDGDLRPIVPMLLHFARDPTAAEYVEDIDFWDHSPPNVDPIDPDAFKDIDLARELRPLIYGSACMRVPYVDRELWLDELVAEIEDQKHLTTASITMLAVLPNLRRLTPSSNWEHFDLGGDEPGNGSEIFWPRLLRGLITGSRGRGKRNTSLAKLSLIRPCLYTGYDSDTGLAMFAPFMILPSVKTMSLTSCKAVDDGYTGETFHWLHTWHPGSSPIECLELSHCCIAGPEIGEAVRHMPNLRILRYAHETKWHGCLHDWDVGDFVAHVGKWCGDFLIELSVTMPALFEGWDGAAPFLKQFIALQHLEVDFRCLEPHTSSIENAGPPPMPSIRPTIELAFTDAPDSKPVYNLADILPKSIRTLGLIGCREWSEHEYEFMQSLLAGVYPRKEVDLPFWERIEVCRDQDSVQCDEEAARWLALLAHMLPPPVEYSYSEPDPAEAAWLREFYPETRE